MKRGWKAGIPFGHSPPRKSGARPRDRAHRDDIFDAISQADVRSGNRERDGFHSILAMARLFTLGR